MSSCATREIHTRKRLARRVALSLIAAALMFLLVSSSFFLFEIAECDLDGVPTRPGLPLSLVSSRPTTYDPIIDGRATSYDEWKDALKIPDLFTDGIIPNAGYYYAEYKYNWNATSPGGNSTIIPGLTLFIAHDINGYPTGNFSHFQIPESDDWNVMEMPTSAGTVTCWVLAQSNTLNDSLWLPESGLSDSSLIPEGTGDDLINDTGYIVRLNNDPSTDRHWFPGDPVPGDPDWLTVGSNFYWTFGNWSFSDSFYITGLDSSLYANEEYEWAVTLTVEPQFCVWWERTYVKIDDKLVWGWTLRGQVWLHYPPHGPPWIPPHIIDQQIENLSSILPTLPTEIQDEVHYAIDMLNQSGTQIISSPRIAMDSVGTAIDYLVNASSLSLDAWNVIIHLLSLEQTLTHEKIYQAENTKVEYLPHQAEFNNQISGAYEYLRFAGIEIQKIFENAHNYTTYDIPVAHFKMSWDHAQMAQTMASPLHDVAISGAVLGKTVVGQGYLVNMSLEGMNVGHSLETFHVVAYYGNSTLACEQWDIFWSMGDCNRDGYINQTDADIITANFGWTGPPGSNSADINSDGIVNIYDATLCSGNQGYEVWWYFLAGGTIGTQTVANLPPGNTTSLTFTWNTTAFAMGNYTVSAYTCPVSDETDSADNNFTGGVVTVTILGDLNGDLSVSLIDLVILANAYGSKPNDANWNPNADINSNNIVGSSDLALMAMHYGQHNP